MYHRADSSLRRACGFPVSYRRLPFNLSKKMRPKFAHKKEAGNRAHNPLTATQKRQHHKCCIRYVSCFQSRLSPSSSYLSFFNYPNYNTVSPFLSIAKIRSHSQESLHIFYPEEILLRHTLTKDTLLPRYQIRAAVRIPIPSRQSQA